MQPTQPLLSDCDIDGLTCSEQWYRFRCFCSRSRTRSAKALFQHCLENRHAMLYRTFRENCLPFQPVEEALTIQSLRRNTNFKESIELSQSLKDFIKSPTV